MSYDPDGTAPLVVTPAEEEEEDE
eukprot:COSAG02_NODE_5984_length_3890_cov_11.855447_4_plen_23_part_01